MSNMIKTIKYNNIPAGEFKWCFCCISLLTTAIATLIIFRSQSYQTFIFPVFRFWLLSLRVWYTWKKCVYWTMAKLSSEKQKNSSFTKKKSLVGLAPVLKALCDQIIPHLTSLLKSVLAEDDKISKNVLMSKISACLHSEVNHNKKCIK